MSRYEVKVTFNVVLEADTKDGAEQKVKRIVSDGCYDRPDVYRHLLVSASAEDDTPDLSWCPDALRDAMTPERANVFADFLHSRGWCAVRDESIPGCHWITDGGLMIRVEGDALPAAKVRGRDLRAACGPGEKRAEGAASAERYESATRFDWGRPNKTIWRRLGAGYYDETKVSLVEDATPGATWLVPIVNDRCAALRLRDGKTVAALMPGAVDADNMREVSP
jgi:hypothetical protein